MAKQVIMALLLVVVFALQSCASVDGTAGLKTYVDTNDGYQFLYPNGWLPVQVTNGPDVVFHDIIEQTDNVSVVISPVSSGKTLRDLGDPGEVGYKLAKTVIAPASSGREAELISAESRELAGKTYYLLEYAVKVGDRQRHNLASAVVDHGNLYTFNASTPEARWEKVKALLTRSVKSFSVY